MQKPHIVMLPILIIIMLTACGFQLRGQETNQSLPATIFLVSDDPRLQATLINQLSVSGVQTITDVKLKLSLHEQAAQYATSLPEVSISNTAEAKQALLFNDNGTPIQWQLDLSTRLSGKHQQINHTIRLQEYIQVNINDELNVSNDVILTDAWQNLYDTLAKNIITAIPKILAPTSDN